MNVSSGGGASEELLTVDLSWGKRVSLTIGTLLVNLVSVGAQLPTPVHILAAEIEHSKIVSVSVCVCVCVCVYTHIPYLASSLGQGSRG